MRNRYLESHLARLDQIDMVCGFTLAFQVFSALESALLRTFEQGLEVPRNEIQNKRMLLKVSFE